MSKVPQKNDQIFTFFTKQFFTNRKKLLDELLNL